MHEPVKDECAKLRASRVFVPHVPTCLRAFAPYVPSFFTGLTCLHFFKCFQFLTWLMCLHFFYIKCGTTHNQRQQAGIRTTPVSIGELLLTKYPCEYFLVTLYCKSF